MVYELESLTPDVDNILIMCKTLTTIFMIQVKTIEGHSVPLAGLGGFILIFGFLAFNGGSQVGCAQNILQT